MGGWFSKSNTTPITQKVGTINNGQIVIHESIPIHNTEVLVLIYIILALIIIKVILKLYKFHNRRMHKRFIRTRQSTDALNTL